ncbi:ABC transporter substrate-binding protein [Methylobacterium bullatum]|uniref:Iron(3+)-hydroxamate-binding protein FhuD n=1 Tax=Methylobacterium bullatum TaxID=570505 RepID=A0A679JZR9_9HYPH|nr:Iron(3+)-hydroxamate-binding protein FhuD [Methylobacterium bullatum]
MSARRAVLGLAACLLVLACLPARAEKKMPAQPRVAALDWSAVELLLGLGIVPIAVTQPENYNRTVVAPALPEGVVDLGLVVEPNLEVLASLKPDLILANPIQVATQGSFLSRIAPTEAVSIANAGGDPYARAKAETMRIALRLGRVDEAKALEARTEAILDAAAASACPAERHPTYLVWIVDHRNIVVYGRTSLFQTVLDRLRIANAWTGASNASGFTAVGIEQLATGPADARIVHIGPIQSDAARALAGSRLWQTLPPVREHRVDVVAPVWFYGGLPAIARFAELMTGLAKRDCPRG